MVVLGKVIDGKLLDSKAEPMTYRETGPMDGASALFPNVFGGCMTPPPGDFLCTNACNAPERKEPLTSRYQE